jgi:ssDNA-specific exonuclease RecJ
MEKFNHRNYTRAFIRIKHSQLISGEVGAFSLKSFKKGEIIVRAEEFEDNYIIPIDEYKKLDTETKKMVIDYCEIAEDFAVVVKNINHVKNIHYMNHSCAPNVGFDKDDNYVAIKSIKKGEEFLMCYSFLYTNPKFKMKCLCGQVGCRVNITGNDWKDKSLQKSYGNYFCSTIRKKITKNE